MQLEVGSLVTGKVTSITKFGAFIDLGEGKTGMVHISEIAPTYVNEIRDHLTEGQEVKVKVLTVGTDGKIGLSIKKAIDNPPPVAHSPQKPFRREGGRGGADFGRRNNESMTFEDMMNKFKQSSDEKMYDLKRNVESKRGSGGTKRGAKFG
jgi:S1 RNA binding domain protein